MAKYLINQHSSGSYQLFESGTLLCTFSRHNLRETLGSLGRGENWIGSIVRLLNKKYPFSRPSPVRSKEDRLRSMGIETIMNHLKAKGFRVFKKQELDDIDMIRHLESYGYCVEGLVGDYFYSTIENEKSEKSLPEAGCIVTPAEGSMGR